jgi:hypothetical protein
VREAAHLGRWPQADEDGAPLTAAASSKRPPAIADRGSVRSRATC